MEFAGCTDIHTQTHLSILWIRVIVFELIHWRNEVEVEDGIYFPHSGLIIIHCGSDTSATMPRSMYVFTGRFNRSIYHHNEMHFRMAWHFDEWCVDVLWVFVGFVTFMELNCRWTTTGWTVRRNLITDRIVGAIIYNLSLNQFSSMLLDLLNDRERPWILINLMDLIHLAIGRTANNKWNDWFLLLFVASNYSMKMRLANPK